MLRPTRPHLIAVCLAAALAMLPLSLVTAHGDVDQMLEGDPECNPLNLPASVMQPGGQTQEFVPSQPELIALDVCVRGEAGPTEVDVLVRSADAASAVLGGASIVADATAYEHADFSAPIPVEPGETYVIELVTANGLDVTWFGAAPETDVYPGGASNVEATVSDFAFRTYAGAPQATSTLAPTNTRVATSTSTPIASRTPTPTRTATPTHTSTPPLAVETPPPPPPSVAAAGSTPAPPPPPPHQAATRTSGVLGGARRVGLIKPPDVGTGDAPPRPVPVAASLAGVLGLGLLAAGLASIAASRRARR